MKKVLAILLALALLPCAALAQSGNRTIAVSERDFDEDVSGMYALGDRLLISTLGLRDQNLYLWSDADGIVELSGANELSSRFKPDAEENTVELGGETVELDEGEELRFGNLLCTVGDRLFRTVVHSGVEGALNLYLAEIVIEDDGSASFGGFVDIGDDLIEDAGFAYAEVYCDQVCSMDGKIYALFSSVTSGESTLAGIDVETGDVETEPFDAGGQVTCIAPYKDGKLLVDVTEETGSGTNALLYAYDVDYGDFESLGALPISGSDVPMGLCYDAARDRLYYVLGGSIWRTSVTDKGIGRQESFGDMPLDILASAAPVLLGDMYVISSFDGVIGRDVNATSMPTQRLTLAVANGVIENVTRRAYFEFTGTHPEFAVTIGNGIGDAQSLVRSMMSRSADVDIYVMNSSDAAYRPLLSHGFMAELDGSESLSQFAAQIYPQFVEAAKRNGRLCAIPLGVDIPTLILNVEVFTKELGYTEEDVPTTWPQLLALFAELSDGRLEDVPGVFLFNYGATRDSAQQKLFENMLNDYMLWLDADDGHLARGNDVLLALLTGFEQIDWDGFGLPDEQDGNAWLSSGVALFDTSSLTAIGDLSAGQRIRALTLSVAEGEEPLKGANVALAFVNPYSRHRQEAIEYLEAMVGMLSNTGLTDMVPSMNDPVEEKRYESDLKWMNEYIDQLNASLEIAEKRGDDATAANLEAMKSINEELRDDFEANGRWLISPDSLANFRAQDRYFTPSYSSAAGEGVGREIAQYLDGNVTARQFVSAMEKTLQMQRQEQR